MLRQLTRGWQMQMEPQAQGGADPAVGGDVPTAGPRSWKNWSPLPDVREGDESWVATLWRRLCREPTLMFTTAYLLVAFLGLWSSYWFYRGFGISILDYLQASDYLVAGLRDPAYPLIFAIGVLLAMVVSWPEALRRRYPDYVDGLRHRHWWARALFPRSRILTWDGLGIHPISGVSVVVGLFMLIGSAVYMQTKGELLRERGRGEAIQVHLLGDAAPAPGEARLLGTSSAFVYLWWPAQQRAEAVPITSVRQLKAASLMKPKAKAAAVPVATPAPAAVR